MKRISILLAICLLLGIPAQAAAPALFQYQSSRLGFSVTVPGVRQGEVIAEETDTGVNFYHAPSREKYGGEIGSIVVVSPRSDFFSGHYDDMAYQIIAMGKNQIFLWKVPGGGAPTGGDFLDAFRRVSSAFSMENLRKGLVPAQPDGWPKLQTVRHLAYLPVSGGLARPNAPLTRGELAQMLYTLLDAGNKADSYRAPFSDTAGKDCTQAVAYLASYGILTGYADGTFRPDAPISRAAFAVLLHRCQFAAPVGQYGEEFVFADVPAGYWAETYIWRKLLELAMPLCKVHPFFGLLIKELSDLEENHAYGKNDTKDILLRLDRDFENIVSDAKALIEVCLDDRYQPNYSTAERYREAHYDARLCFDDMRYGELATEEVMLERPAYDSAYNYSVEKLREQGIKTALREVLYPNTVRDLYNYLKGYCLRLPLPIHKCKNCGRYFVVTGNITQDYCTRLMEGSEKTCRQMGAVVQYQSRQMKNPATKEFTRSYKAHNARVRYGTMTKAEFTAWSKEARAKRADCIAGKLPLEEFVVWLDSDRQR